MKNNEKQLTILYDNDSSVYDEISDEARAIIESARMLSGGNDELFRAHIKYFCDSPVILREINRILKNEKMMNK